MLIGAINAPNIFSRTPHSRLTITPLDTPPQIMYKIKNATFIA
uniref:Uncharacterized protein n=1 Tax=Rhizophora mucronata TaxID=61149 RepID=A0A2P2R3J9_RHIMU